MLTIYHNPKCKKSRAGLQFLMDSGNPFEVIEYLKNPLTERNIEQLVIKLNEKPENLIRTQEDYYKQNLKGKNFKDHELIRIIVQNPKLLKRPIIESKYRAVFGDPVENIIPLVKKTTAD